MSKKIVNLGSKYWNQKVIGEILANDFDFNREVIKSIIKVEPLCRCNNYGTKIIFRYKDKFYSFNYLTGYPCECES